MSQHRGKTGDCARCAAMGQLAVKFFRHGAFQKHQHQTGHIFRYGHRIDIDPPFIRTALKPDCDAIFKNRHITIYRLLRDFYHRTAKWQKRCQRTPFQNRRTALKKRLRFLVHHLNLQIGVQKQHRVRQCVENGIGRRCILVDATTEQ